MRYTRSELVNILKQNVATVTFTKEDKTTRVMRCTLQDSFIPKNKKPKTSNVKENVLAVFDVEKSDWRSFYVEKVSDVSI